MQGGSGKWLILAGDFPATLNKESRETELAISESPDAYGMDLDTPGLLAAISSEPTGTARIQDTQTVTAPQGETISGVMEWIYNRLWRIDDTNTNHLRYGSPDQRDYYFAQRHGLVPFTDSATAITVFVPAGRGGLVVVKSDGSFYIPNASDRSGKFTKSVISQDFVNATANLVSSFGGVAYTVNSTGVYSFDGEKVTELTAKIRNSLAPFNASAITFDHDKKWMIGGATEWAIDLNNGKLYDYSTAGFRFTSRALRGENHEPISVERLAFMIDHSSTAGGQLSYQAKVEEGDWSDAKTIDLPYEADGYSRVEESLYSEDIATCRKWQMRITSLSSNVRIKQIQVYVTGLEAQDISA